MDPPPPIDIESMTPIDIESMPEKLKEEEKERPQYHCDLHDTELVHKISQALLPGLASACVDNTTGSIFRGPGSVAVDIRKEMVEYLTRRSETFVSEFILAENPPEVEVSEHPYDIISDLIDDFAISKRNVFGRVSNWVLSERREDWIDDFVQEMESNGFWMLARREVIVQTLLKNVDYKNLFHCARKFDTEEDLAEHMKSCSFRTMVCSSEGCDARFCAAHLENHDSVCPFKIIPCEQNCPEYLMRREMDKHCITVCTMKPVNCPFYQVGCQATIPRCKVEEHYEGGLHSHLLCILQTIHKEASAEDLKPRAEQVEKSSTPGTLAGIRNVRTLIRIVKDLDAKLGPLEIKPKVSESTEGGEEKEELSGSPCNKKEDVQSPTKNGEGIEPNKNRESLESPTENKESKEPNNNRESMESPTGNKDSKEPNNNRESMESATENKERKELNNNRENMESSTENKERKEPNNKRESMESPTENKERKELNNKRESMESPTENKERKEPNDDRESMESPTEKERKEPNNKRESMESPTKNKEGKEPHNNRENMESPTENKESKEAPNGGETIYNDQGNQ